MIDGAPASHNILPFRLREASKTSCLPSSAAAAAGVLLDNAAAEGFERFRAPLTSLRFRIDAPAIHAAVLRQLGAPPSWSLHESPTEVLGAAYEAGATLARRLALAGDSSS